MKKIVLSLGLLFSQLGLAQEDICKTRYSAFAREVLVDHICPKRQPPRYEGQVFNSAYNRAEDFYEKYCENTPEVVCYSDMMKDAKAVYEAGEKYINEHEQLQLLADLDPLFSSLYDYLDQEKGVISMSIDRHWDIMGDGPVKILFFYAGGTITTPEEKFAECNKSIGPSDTLTCMGQLQYFFRDINYSVKGIIDGVHLSFVSQCLERTGFDACDLKMFETTEDEAVQ